MTAPAELVRQAINGSRRGLAQLLTAIEDSPIEAAGGLGSAHGRPGGARIVGITGAPGSGKSTLTNALIACLRSQGEAVAVLAVDPSSPFSGGALLGDRIRMNDHAGDEGVFIRSMASRGQLGGIAAAVPLAVRVLDLVGFEWVIVETVGVGQIEVAIAGQADLTVVVLTPGWGDHVQANKAGLLEIADAFVVNKADLPGAKATLRDLRTALMLSGPGIPRPPILLTEAHNGAGVDELAATLRILHSGSAESGELDRRQRARLRGEITEQAAALAVQRLNGGFSDGDIDRLVDRVTAGELSPSVAAHELAGFSLGAAV